MVVRYRRHAGLTQHQLALRLGVSASSVASWETGARWPNDRQLVNLIDECHLNPAELFAPRRKARAR